MFREVCAQPTLEDGLKFAADSVTSEIIKSEQEYEGVRIHLQATLERARIPVQIDIAFGDAITPGPERIQYPSLLGFPTPIVATYPKETVIAEKLHALATLGMTNSRIKDFFDLWVLSERFEFDGELVTSAIRATFERRRTTIPDEIPLALTAEFFSDPHKQRQWRGFISKGAPAAAPPEFSLLIATLRDFLWPPLEAIHTSMSFSQHWTPQGQWRERG